MLKLKAQFTNTTEDFNIITSNEILKDAFHYATSHPTDFYKIYLQLEQYTQRSINVENI